MGRVKKKAVENISKIEAPDIIRNFLEVNQENLQFLVCVRPKSDELYILDIEEQSVKVIKNDKKYFDDQSLAFENFPENGRYVNLGNSLLFTGGMFNNIPTSNCYLLFLEKKGKGQFHISIMPYSNMIQKRERHNMLFIKDRNMIFVCSGFYNDFAEFSDLSSQQWTSLPKMNFIRANGSLAYISNKFVYCIGGYNVKDKKKPGIYLNSCEFVDMDNLGLGWKSVDFENTGHSIKNCAMGVIPIQSNGIIICGGYDGTLYKSEVYIMKFKEEKVAIVKSDETLQGNVIFPHNQFARINNNSYNFDCNMNLIKFDPITQTFEVSIILK